jgi:hypothetical protein
LEDGIEVEEPMLKHILIIFLVLFLYALALDIFRDWEDEKLRKKIRGRGTNA